MPKGIRTFLDLRVYQLSHEIAIEIFTITRSFPSEEKYSLTDQIRRSSRSVAANIAEGWGKRKFENVFKRHLTDAIGSLEETKSWLYFCLHCQYITPETYEELQHKMEETGSMIWKLHSVWESS